MVSAKEPEAGILSLAEEEDNFIFNQQ